MQTIDPRESVQVGGPLSLAEARFLEHELKQAGIACAVRRERKLEADRDATHFVMVMERDLEAAGRLRQNLLDDDRDGSPAPRSRHASRRGPLILGILGLVVGLRIGTRLHGPGWLAVLIPIVFALASFGCGILLQPGGDDTDTRVDLDPAVEQGERSRDGDQIGSDGAVDQPGDRKPPGGADAEDG